MRSSFAANSPALLLPQDRQEFTQGFEPKCRRLAAVEDHLNDVSGAAHDYEMMSSAVTE